jgi:hypothetical protein
VYGPQQLALWVRKRDDGLAKAVRDRLEVTLFYLDLAERGVVYTFYGREIVSDEPHVNDQVWAATSQREQAQDPDRRGVALIIELERVAAQGIRPERNFTMARPAT